MQELLSVLLHILLLYLPLSIQVLHFFIKLGLCLAVSNCLAYLAVTATICKDWRQCVTHADLYQEAALTIFKNVI